jgi:hypothetical protein
MLNSGHLNISYYLDKKMKNYSEEKLNQALEVLRNQNGKGMRAVSRDFGKLSSLFTPSTSNTPSSQSDTSSLLSPFSSLLNNMTINQPTRTAKRRIEYLADMKGYADRINETAQNFQQSILEALKRETTNTDNSSRKRKRNSIKKKRCEKKKAK